MKVKCEYLGSLEISQTAQSLNLACRAKTINESKIKQLSNNLLKEAEFIKSFLDKRYNPRDNNTLVIKENQRNETRSKSEALEAQKLSPIKSIVKRQNTDYSRPKGSPGTFEIEIKRIPTPLCTYAYTSNSTFIEDEDLDPFLELNNQWKCNLL